MTEKYYRGYILFRLAKIGTEWEIVDKMMKMKSDDNGKEWRVSYCTPIYGAWDLIAEVSFSQLENLDTVVTSIRMDADVKDYIEETTTLVSSKPNYPMD
ncbi:MAG: hypothetical protein GF364_18460 [Candidatus Lokiarchaeota archaeon]|nr:hypothetical protein [Candidatus Lokiarchaeota archaeon]